MTSVQAVEFLTEEIGEPVTQDELGHLCRDKLLTAHIDCRLGWCPDTITPGIRALNGGAITGPSEWNGTVLMHVVGQVYVEAPEVSDGYIAVGKNHDIFDMEEGTVYPILFKTLDIIQLASDINSEDQLCQAISAGSADHNAELIEAKERISALVLELSEARADIDRMKRALDEFNEKPLDPRARATHERLTYVLACMVDLPIDQPSKAEGIVKAKAAELVEGWLEGNGTIAGRLKDAQARYKKDIAESS